MTKQDQKEQGKTPWAVADTLRGGYERGYFHERNIIVTRFFTNAFVSFFDKEMRTLNQSEAEPVKIALDASLARFLQ